METGISPKIDILEKTLEFQFLLLLLCYITFTNSFFVVIANTDILHITDAILKDKINIGLSVVGLAMFSFVMSVVVRPLRCGIVMLVGRYIESLVNTITNENTNLSSNKIEFHSIYKLQRLAIKYDNKYLYMLLDENKTMQSKLNKGALLAFALWFFLIIDLGIALLHGGYSLSLIRIVGSMANKLPDLVSGAVQFTLWGFSTLIFIYALHPRTGDNYVFISNDILETIEGISSDKCS